MLGGEHYILNVRMVCVVLGARVEASRRCCSDSVIPPPDVILDTFDKYHLFLLPKPHLFATTKVP